MIIFNWSPNQRFPVDLFPCAIRTNKHLVLPICRHILMKGYSTFPRKMLLHKETNKVCCFVFVVGKNKLREVYLEHTLAVSCEFSLYIPFFKQPFREANSIIRYNVLRGSCSFHILFRSNFVPFEFCLIWPSALFLSTVEPPVAKTPLLCDQFSKILKVSKSNHYIHDIWNLL